MAAKEKQIFFCKECGYESAKWQGQCPGCRAWNTFVEEKVKVGVKGAVKQPKDAVSPMGILQVTTAEESRVQTGMRELDRVLGGGIVKGSLVLVGGDPGIGKSTILLQMCRNLVHQNVNVLYTTMPSTESIFTTEFLSPITVFQSGSFVRKPWLIFFTVSKITVYAFGVFKSSSS